MGRVTWLVVPAIELATTVPPDLTPISTAPTGRSPLTSPSARSPSMDRSASTTSSDSTRRATSRNGVPRRLADLPDSAKAQTRPTESGTGGGAIGREDLPIAGAYSEDSVCRLQTDWPALENAGALVILGSSAGLMTHETGRRPAFPTPGVARARSSFPDGSRPGSLRRARVLNHRRPGSRDATWRGRTAGRSVSSSQSDRTVGPLGLRERPRRRGRGAGGAPTATRKDARRTASLIALSATFVILDSVPVRDV